MFKRMVALIAAVAVLALLLPTGSSGATVDADPAGVTAGQVARGKATVPGARSSEPPAETTPNTF